jgi:hypothetical protein
MPTPVAVGLIIQQVAAERNQNVLAVDIGGATTDVFSVFGGNFHRTVSANYGMSYNICNVMAEAGVANIMRWLPFTFDLATLRDILRNKMIRPTTVPETLEELYIEQAAAREALRLSLDHHRQLAVHLRGASKRRDFSDAFAMDETSVVNVMALDLCIGSGGVLSHAPDRTQSALMMLDAFELEGVTQLAVDSIFMMPQLGVMSQLCPEAAREVFLRDCLILLGTSVAPTGIGRPGQHVMDVALQYTDGRSERHRLSFGELRRLPLPVGATAQAVIEPSRRFDVGAGPGKPREAVLHGGVAGIILDARGRPLSFPIEPGANAAQRRRDHEALQLPLPAGAGR